MRVPLGTTRLGGIASKPAVGFVFACVLPCVLFGVLVGADVVVHPERAAVGWNPSGDFQIMTWGLAWWPWAFDHGVNPMTTSLLWAPHGFPTLWITSMPAVALLALPLTLSVGPLAAYNVMMFAAVALAGGSVYLLCRELAGRAGPAVVGGVLFAMSPYMVGHLLSQHLNLVFVWPMPLIAWSVVRRWRGRWRSERAYVLFTAGLLVIELGSSLELFVDLAIVLALAFAIAVASHRTRAREVLRVARGVALGYSLCLPLLAAVAWIALAHAHGGLRYGPSDYSIDLANLVLPTPLTLLGASRAADGIARHYAGNIGEQDGYLGLPLLGVSALAIRARWNDGGAFAAVVLVAVVGLSLGPWLTVAGHPVAHLPLELWNLPVLADVLPARLSVFTMLVAACLAAVWLSLPRRRSVQAAAGALILISLLPNLALARHVAGAWSTTSATRFSTAAPSLGPVASSRWSGVVHAGDTALVLPTGDRTDSLYWQVRAAMRFRLAVPATPFVPPALDVDPTIVGLVNDSLPSVDGSRLAAARLRTYLLADRVRVVVVTAVGAPRWRRIAEAATGAAPERLGSTLVYRVPATLPVLRAAGELVRGRAGRAHIAAWLFFDGLHAHVEAKIGSGAATAISPQDANAESVAVATNAAGRSAVVFTDERRGVLEVRVATYSRGGGWHVDTIDRRARPVWAPHAAVEPSGAVIASWLAAAVPTPLLRATILAPGAGRPVAATLDAAQGISGVTAAPVGRSAWRIAWQDSVGADHRVRTALLRSGWRDVRTIGATFIPIAGVRVDGRKGDQVVWLSNGRHVWRDKDP